MIDMDFVRGYFPPQMRGNALFSKHMLKEYIQAMILDFLSSTPYMRKMLEPTDLNIKKCGFEHLLFDKRNADGILQSDGFVESI